MTAHKIPAKLVFLHAMRVPIVHCLRKVTQMRFDLILALQPIGDPASLPKPAQN